MDPDDILLNQDIFQELYDYNQKYNLDIIEFLVYFQREGQKDINFPEIQSWSHYLIFNMIHKKNNKI